MRAPHKWPCPSPHYFSWGKQNTQRSHVQVWIFNDHLHFYWLFDGIQIGWKVITDWQAWVMIMVTQIVQTPANDVTSIRQLLYRWHFCSNGGSEDASTASFHVKCFWPINKLSFSQIHAFLYVLEYIFLNFGSNCWTTVTKWLITSLILNENPKAYFQKCRKYSNSGSKIK